MGIIVEVLVAEDGDAAFGDWNGELVVRDGYGDKRVD